VIPACFQHVSGWLDAPDQKLHRGTFDSLANWLPWRQETIRAYGREHAVPRMTAWFGDAPYTYSGVRHDPAPMPGTIDVIRRRLEDELGARFNTCLANLYRGGHDSVAWHSDDEPELGTDPVIASVSLGAVRTFAIREARTDDPMRWTFPLGHGDLLVMRGESQRLYQHSVPKTARPVLPRINLTFRLTQEIL